MVPRLVVLGAAAALLGATAQPRTAAAGRVQPNDNRRPAGTMRSGVLSLRLETRLAMWHPDGDDAPGTPMAAFGEEGGTARIPGPLVRVRAGTEVDVSVRNSLPDTLLLHGLHARTTGTAADASPIILAPGERRTVRFRLDLPGTYYYWGTTTRRPMQFRTLGDAQLTGAIVVDARGAPPARDRVLVVGMWTDTVHRAGTHRQRVLGVINGRSWPHTERLSYAVGDSVQWRVINASADLHPMHLHGFYFLIDSRGDADRDTVYAPAARPLAVTESMGAGATMRLTWVPERPGNWLFHCHVPEHIGARGPLGALPPHATEGGGSSHADHATSGMNGLVMGISVRESRGAGGQARSRTGEVRHQFGAERSIRLLVRASPGSTQGRPLYGYTLHEGGAEPPPGPWRGVGETLDLVRGQPVRIAVVNRLPEPTAVHWHGIELESYFDGVPGFSGNGRRVTPMIAPGDSFIVRFTPPRAGTFIYHTHADEVRQQFAGLAGALVVRDGLPPRDAATDIPVVLTQALDSARNAITLVNGRAIPAPLRLTTGTTYRFRMIQIAADRSMLRTELLRDSAVMQWHPVAKDGAGLPVAARGTVPARLRFGIGETYDFEFTPDAPGAMRLEVRQGARWELPAPLYVTLPIHVAAPGPPLARE